MGVQKSNLNINQIEKILRENYSIIPTKIKEVNRGTANIFEIETNDTKYILKEFNEKRTVESILKEINIINFLRENDIYVPTYIKTVHNTFYVMNENRIIIVQKFINGYTMENNTGDFNKVMESARILGKITKTLRKYPELSEDGIIEKNFSKCNLLNKISKMEELSKNIKNNNPYKEKILIDLKYKIEIGKKIYNTFDFSVIRKMTIINSHGDFSVQQLIYNNNNETAVIDFETAKKLPIVWEVLRSYSYIDEQAKDGNLNIETLIKYFREFYKYIPLNDFDLKYAPHLYIIQLISSTFGYKEYNNDFTQDSLLKFAFFRTNLCRFLYKNINEISQRLIKEVKDIGEKNG